MAKETSFVEQLQEIVDGMARAGALTPAAIRQFEEMRQNLVRSETELKRAAEDRDIAQRRAAAAEGLVREKTTALNDMEKRSQKAEARIEEAERAIWKSNQEIERRIEMRSILSDVFRNIEVRRMVSHTVPVPMQMSGGTTYVQPHLETTETAEKQV